MKLLSITLVALFCAVAVSAIPSPLDDEFNFLTEEPLEPASFGILDGITKKLDGFFKYVMCSLNVIGDVVKETDFNKDYEKFKAAVEAVVKKDLKMCMNSKGFKEKVKCYFESLKTVGKLFIDFMHNVEKTNKELAKKIQKEVKTKCMKKDTVNFIELDDEATFGIKDEIKKQIDMILKAMKCAKKVIGEEVAGAGYKKDFEEFKAKINGLLKTDAKKCDEMKGLKDRFLCSLEVSKKLVMAFADFMHKIEKTNKDLAQKIVKSVKTKCFKKGLEL